MLGDVTVVAVSAGTGGVDDVGSDDVEVKASKSFG